MQRVLDVASQPPPVGERRWSVRSLARETGLSPATVYRIQREQMDGDPLPILPRLPANNVPSGLSTRVTDAAGLFLAPPVAALVLTIDEFRSLPVSALGRVSAAAELLRAVNGADRSSLSRIGPADLTAFLSHVGRAHPGRALCVVVNESAVGAAERAWQKSRPNTILQIVPRQPGWIEAVAVWFAVLAAGSHDGHALAERVRTLIERHARSAEPFTWLATESDAVGSDRRFESA